MLRYLLLLLLLCLQACTTGPPQPGLGAAVPWERLRGWEADKHAAAWPALLASCSRINDQSRWRAVCRAAGQMDNPTDTEARRFFEANFQPHPVYGEDGRREALITGYYQPLLRGSFERDHRYRYPLYAVPDDLLTIDLGEAYPELAGRQLRGRLDGRTVVPYPDRSQLEADPGRLAGSELLWVDDPFDAFFLQVQGSGRIRLPDGRTVAVGYADNNGRAYRSIGRRLIEAGEIPREDLNLFTIRRWLHRHPERASEILDYNPRYIFFRLRTDAPDNPEGALNVPLTPGRSLAVDPDKLPLGAPVWLETSIPGEPDVPMARLMLAQDTGGAIKGYNRADVFWGQGDDAERKAGLMKHKGRLFVLLPRAR